jgi:hypothetical protein
MLAGIRLPVPPLLESPRNVMGANASVGRATKNMYIETAINARSARNVVRCIFGLREWPIAMIGRVNVDDIGDVRDCEGKLIGTEKRLFVRR